MANEEHLKVLKQGVEVWNKWRAANRYKPDLSYADLTRVDLSHANLSGANLDGANLVGANLSGAYFNRASLNAANLMGTNLANTKFNGARLSKADLSEADLTRAYFMEAILNQANLIFANLHGVELSGADLSDAAVGYSTFTNVDLSTVKGLETVKHEGPSTIGIDTIYLSKGKIPAQFLQGAGVSENFIEYMSSLVGTAFEFYSCFISYSGKDQNFADRLYADLQHEGVRCWFAPHHVQTGKKLHEQIDSAIRLHEKLLLILSPDSINSEWVKTEIAKARKRETNEGKRVLFPVRLNISYEQLQEWECFDADRGKDSAREIREYYIPDFTKWKNHDQYLEEFKKLVRDLKKEDVS